MGHSVVLLWVCLAFLGIALCADRLYKTTLECHVVGYKYNVSKPYRTRDGLILRCEDEVYVSACYGRCDTSEVGDFKPPFKRSRHRVCTYGKKKFRKIMLSRCHPSHPDPSYTVFDAESCVCTVCDPNDTSCEFLDGR